MFARPYFSSVNPYTLSRPSGGLQRLRQDFDRLFEGVWQPADEYPAVNLWHNGEGAIAVVELPGFAPGDIEISVVQNVLTLRGERSAPEPKEGEAHHRRERWYGKFTRSLALPFEVESAAVEAKFKHGVLSIALPRAEAHRPQKIAIHTN
ncbi:MAG: Hsp20/alpha crystallin family protein [Candidatus Latescibacteria bacterium]|nr:Hsp20/alpha crystallin family protein [Candidatus Latescibacterota bacterium]